MIKRISLILALALLAALLGGCRFAVVETDSVQIGWLASALAEPVEPEDDGVPLLYSRDRDGDTLIQDTQQRLRALEYLDDKANGYFGKKTQEALMAFQRDCMIPQTGLLDARTRQLLESATPDIRLDSATPAPTAAPATLPIQPGSEGVLVKEVQQALRRYGFYSGLITGEYDEATQAAAAQFQKYCVAEYGTEFDVPPREELLLAEPLPEEELLLSGDAPGTTPTPRPTYLLPQLEAPTPEPTLRPDYEIDGSVSAMLYGYLTSDRFPLFRRTVQRGDYGDDVRRVQARLASLDYFYAEQDGDFTEITANALKLFQQRNGLQATGIANRETQEKLYGDADIVALEMVDMPFYIKVSIADQRVYVYRWVDGDYTFLCREMVCSTGAPGHDTPTGVFVSPGHRDGRWHFFKDYGSWAQYAFIIKGDILFHSILFYGPDEDDVHNSTIRALGTRASHGCVRLAVIDARWVYEHCGKGQVVEIY